MIHINTSTYLFTSYDLDNFVLKRKFPSCGNDLRLQKFDNQVYISNFDGPEYLLKNITLELPEWINASEVFMDNTLCDTKENYIQFITGRNMNILDITDGTLKIMNKYSPAGVNYILLNDIHSRLEFKSISGLDRTTTLYNRRNKVKINRNFQFNIDPNDLKNPLHGMVPLFSFGGTTVTPDDRENMNEIRLGVGHIKFATFEKTDISYKGKLEAFRQNIQVLDSYYGTGSINNFRGYIGHCGSSNNRQKPFSYRTNEEDEKVEQSDGVCYTYLFYFYCVYYDDDFQERMKISDSFLPLYLDKIESNLEKKNNIFNFFKFSLFFPMGMILENDTIKLFGGEGDWRCVAMDINLDEVIDSCKYGIETLDDVFMNDVYNYKYLLYSSHLQVETESITKELLASFEGEIGGNPIHKNYGWLIILIIVVLTIIIVFGYVNSAESYISHIDIRPK